MVTNEKAAKAGRWPYRHLRAHVTRALARSSVFRNPSVWGAAVVAFDGEGAECRVLSRTELASEFQKNDMPDLAREVLTRRVGPGRVLLWLVTDDEHTAGCNFAVLDLIGKAVARC